MVLVYFDRKNKKWVDVPKQEVQFLPQEDQDRVFYLDGKLREKLDFAKLQMSRNNDCIGIIFGDEGSGKSAKAGLCMKYMTDDNFDPKKQLVGGDYEDAVTKIDATKEGGALMFDEGNVFFLNTDAMTGTQKNLHKLFSIFRQKRMFVVIVLPSIFRLGSYFALDRSRFAIRTYLKDGKRGYFGYYGEKQKNKLYRIGKRFNNPLIIPPSFRGRFKTCPELEDESYKKFKRKTLEEALHTAKKPLMKHKSAKEIKMELYTNLIKQNEGVGSTTLAKYIGLSESYIRIIRKKLADNKNIPGTEETQEELTEEDIKT